MKFFKMATKLEWKSSNKSEPRGHHETAMVAWVYREVERGEDDELVVDGWLFLQSNQQTVFGTIDEAINDFYAYIEWIELSGLCSRLGAFIVANDMVGSHPQERDTPGRTSMTQRK